MLNEVLQELRSALILKKQELMNKIFIEGTDDKVSTEQEVVSVDDSSVILDLSLPPAVTSVLNENPDENLISELHAKHFEDNLDTSQLPIPSPCNDFIEREVDTSPRCSYPSPSNSDVISPSIMSRDSSPLVSSDQNSSACSSNDNTPAGRMSRNRQRRRDEWKDIKRKCLKNLGKAYLSRNGVSRDGKRFKQSCPATCRLKCFQKFTEQDRNQIFLSFWQLGDHSRHWDYIANHTQVAETRYPSTSRAVSRRKKTVKYNLPLSRDTDVPREIIVCKTMFLNTLSIGERTVQTALSKWFSGRARVVVIDDEIKEGVIRHVKTFRPVESHYVRKKSSKLYLDGDLMLTKMFSLYNEWCEAENIIKKAKTVRQYRNIINQNLNIAFHVLKKDICNECHVYNTNKRTMNDEEKKKQEVNMQNKTIAREMKEKDKKDAIKSQGKIITACFDFQKILNCPHGNVELFYYKRKLSIHNWCVVWRIFIYIYLYL
ncbi:hypothetical protein ABMA27_012963 [Loxostege sticticalis]|uniref:Transposase n=1 Tax=Loxostege sticticalis TaxID=481309 RepID=A0ABR3IDK4_LOXSC